MVRFDQVARDSVLRLYIQKCVLTLSFLYLLLFQCENCHAAGSASCLSVLILRKLQLALGRPPQQHTDYRKYVKIQLTNIKQLSKSKKNTTQI